MPDKTGKAPTARDLIRRQGLMDDMMARCSVDLLAVIGKDGGTILCRGALAMPRLRFDRDVPRLALDGRWQALV